MKYILTESQLLRVTYDAPAFEMDPDHVHFKHQYNEGELTERCWKGYTQKGMKTMFGKRYPNCVKSKK